MWNIVLGVLQVYNPFGYFKAFMQNQITFSEQQSFSIVIFFLVLSCLS